jgi:hypothetical protein
MRNPTIRVMAASVRRLSSIHSYNNTNPTNLPIRPINYLMSSFFHAAKVQVG